MSFSADVDVRITDTSLRDGSHAKQHQFTEAHIRTIVGALDAAGVPVIEVTHGDGLGGSSFNYGFSLVDERLLMRAAVETATRARIAALMLPGIGTADDIRAAADLGISVIRIATHCTEADVSEQHFRISRDIGLETVGFLMMAHTQPPEVLAAQSRVMADAGCQCVYVVDSAGAMLPDEAAARVGAVVAELGDDAQAGFHGHENLSLALANTLAAISVGAVQVDSSTRHFGAGSGNTATEALAAVCARIGIRSGVDPLAMFDVAEEVVRPVMDGECVQDRLSLVMGYAGVYSSFLKHAFRAAQRYDVPGAEILLECGRQQLIGGQEDQIIQIASELSRVRSGTPAEPLVAR
ncbi:MAG TPA: 4-hydroxy-2-oxovalerate aldolase [Acidimicrobiales bacterium]|nr:4-hydroxy-2-oxovalerate aldolase [Acidimicrobiales bacterium]